MEIVLLSEDNDLLKKGIHYFWSKWGNESNFDSYEDCIVHSIQNTNSLPKFYVLLDEGKIIGSYALLTNDLISRQDLLPWFACLFIDEEYRNQGLAEKLLDHSLTEAQNIGFDSIYLSTDLNNFYEKKGWNYFAKGYSVFGNSIKIYVKKII